jgi:hypothetical protein
MGWMSDPSHQRLAEWAAFLDEELPDEYAVEEEDVSQVLRSE